MVPDAEGDLDRGDAFEQDRDLAPEAEVLRPLPDVEREGRFAAAEVAAVELDEAVLALEPRQRGLEGLFAEDIDVEEAVRNVRRGDEFVDRRGRSRAPLPHVEGARSGFRP